MVNIEHYRNKKYELADVVISAGIGACGGVAIMLLMIL